MTERNKSIRELLRNEEVKLSDLFLLLSEKKKVFFATVLIVVILGMLKSCTTPVEYESVAIMLSEVKEEGNGIGQLGGLAGLAGINLSGMNGSNMTQAFSPELYPKLLESKPFLLDLIKHEFFFESKGKEMSLMEYYLEERPGDILTKSFDFLSGIPHRVLSIFEPSRSDSTNFTTVVSKDTVQVATDHIYITPEENYVIDKVKNLIKIENKERMITLSVRMPEPLIAAELNVLVFDKILDFVSTYKIEKQKNNLEFIQSSVHEAEENFKKAQLNLASFRDSNQGIVSERAKTREEQLELEFTLAFQLYSTLKQELENSRIELKKETPIFTTFEEAVVPNGPSNTPPTKILIISVFLGGLLGIFVIFVVLARDYING